METACVYEQTTVIHELTQGIQMAKKLRANLNSPQARDFLIHNILSSYDKLLFVLKSADSTQPPMPSGLPDSPISGGSLQSGDFEFGQNVVSKKRKAPTEWEEHVRICTDDGFEGKTDDGYNWRKYGQKLILGSKYPRSYYRCTYRKAKNCLATKQVQRTDGVSAVFDISYKGKHTCDHGGQSAAPSPPSPEKYEIEPPHHHHHNHHYPSSPNPSDTLSDLKANLSVNTTDLGATDAPTFSFTPTPFGILDDIMDDCDELVFPNLFDDELLPGYSPSFISPANSESNNFSDWNSLPFMDFPTDPADTFPNYKFSNSYLVEGCSLR